MCTPRSATSPTAQSVATTATSLRLLLVRADGATVSSPGGMEFLAAIWPHPVTETGDGPIGLFGAIGTVVEAAGTDPFEVVVAAAAAAFLAAAAAAALAVIVAPGATVVGVVPENPTVTTVVVGVVVDVAVAVLVVHAGVVIVSESSVTAPLRASTRPCIVTPVVTVMLCIAMIVPSKLEADPSVAELPTCQNTLQACAPLIRSIWLALAVVSVLVFAWKTNTASGLPPASRVSAPVRPIDEAELYTPGVKVWPPRSATIGEVGPSLAAVLYAVTRSVWA
jgi:hypothetical protein